MYQRSPLLKAFLTIAFVVFVPHAFAEEGVVADIGISDTGVKGQSGSDLEIGFTISNRADRVQSDVRYGVELVRQSEGGQTIVDSFLAPETLAIGPGASEPVRLDYAAPGYLSGTYDLWAMVRTTGGVVLGISKIETVKLSGTATYVDLRDCVVKIGMSGETTWLAKGISASPSDELVLSCTAENLAAEPLSVRPSFRTFERSVYGAPVEAGSAVVSDISFAAHEEKGIDIVLPHADRPQAYDVAMTLRNVADISEASGTIVTHYVVPGASATIQDASFGKDSYAKGEIVDLSVFWSGSADASSGLGPVTLSAEVTGADGRTCVSDAIRKTVSDAGTVTLSAVATAGCEYPGATVTLRDAAGTLLDERVVGTAPVGEDRDGKDSGTAAPVTDSGPGRGIENVSRDVALLVVSVLFLVSILAIALKRGGRRGIRSLAVLAVLSGALVGAEAEAVTWEGGGNTFTVTADREKYSVSENVHLDAIALVTACSNGELGYSLTASLSGKTVQLGSGFPQESGTVTYYLSGDLTAPGTPGSYAIELEGCDLYTGECGSASIPITVIAGNNGICGNADGQETLSSPSDDLCSKGYASGVEGTGPWIWTCFGTDGGADDSCYAPKADTFRMCHNGAYYASEGETGTTVTLPKSDTSRHYLRTYFDGGSGCSGEDVTWYTNFSSSVPSVAGMNPLSWFASSERWFSVIGKGNTLIQAVFGERSIAMPVQVSDITFPGPEDPEDPEGPGSPGIPGSGGGGYGDTNWREVAPGD